MRCKGLDLRWEVSKFDHNTECSSSEPRARSITLFNGLLEQVLLAEAFVGPGVAESRKCSGGQALVVEAWSGRPAHILVVA